MYKAILLSLAISLACSQAFTAQAGKRPSQWAETHQRIGLTDLSIEYSRPNTKGRTIWGELVPFGTMWRTGANEATKFTTSDDIKIEGKALKAGSYSVFAIPTEGDWTIHFNTDISLWGTGDYTDAKDVLVITIPTSKGTKVESMRFTFDNISATTSQLTLAWDELRCSFNIEVDVETKLFENLAKKIKNSSSDDLAYNYLECALQCAEQKLRIDQGVEWIEKSIELEPNYWYAYWVKADVLWEKGDKEGSLENLNTALVNGLKEEGK
ncbi:MAG: DUF2911 domain-containing protein, partial [Flavobacteriales bacterium]|nr:DUF2911 domain-containing protein [Flavobacteriales bacterium]